MEIVQVETNEQIARVQALFGEYWTSFGFTPCFQNFEEEVASLPGKYAAPEGRLALAYVDGVAAGCVAMRRVDANRAEMKRLYVRPDFRGLGIGRDLLRWLIAEARLAGYRDLVCDTMPVMSQALAMYERLGFERTEPYSAEATPEAIFLRLSLV